MDEAESEPRSLSLGVAPDFCFCRWPFLWCLSQFVSLSLLSLSLLLPPSFCLSVSVSCTHCFFCRRRAEISYLSTSFNIVSPRSRHRQRKKDRLCNTVLAGRHGFGRQVVQHCSMSCCSHGHGLDKNCVCFFAQQHLCDFPIKLWSSNVANIDYLNKPLQHGRHITLRVDDSAEVAHTKHRELGPKCAHNVAT